MCSAASSTPTDPVEASRIGLKMWDPENGSAVTNDLEYAEA